MSGPVVAALAAAVAVLFAVVVYQRIQYRRGTQARLEEMARTLESILDTDSDEKVLVFTGDRALIRLAAQIDRLLESRQRARADFLRAELSSKKMLSNISHDIKTPMTVILGYLEIMRLGGGGAEMLEKVEAQAQRVMELIDQFFTLAKLEAGDADLPLTQLAVNEPCREAVLDFYELLAQRQFQVEVDVPDQPVLVQANADALHRVLVNLISNVLRYGEEGKYLGLVLRTDQRWAYIDVVDHGKGIEPAFAHTVFQRLFTLEDSRNKDIQGNGLGLTIAKSLAQGMGGDLTLRSEPHVKTVFTVALKRVLY